MRGLALLWLCVIVFAPGLGAMLALFRPGQLGLAARLAVTFGLGYAVVGIIAYVLTLLQVMRIVPFFVLLAAATVGLWYLAARRSSLREQGRAAIDEVRSDPWSIGLGLVVIAAIAAIRMTFLDHFPIIAPFRYWVDGLEIADAGRIPSLSLHYGTLYPPATSKVLLNSFNAGVSFSIGQDSPAALAALNWVASVGLAIGLWAAGRELGLRFTAPLLPVLLIANRLVLSKEMTLDMGSYKAEVFGRMVAASALVLAIRALRNRKARTDALVAGALLAAAAGTHLVPVLVVVVFLGWYAVSLLVVERDLSGLLRQGLVIGLTLGVVGGTLLLLPRGDIGFQGAERPEEYDQIDRAFDETQYLYTGRMVAPRGPVRWFLAPRRVVNAYMVRTFNLPVQTEGSANSTFAMVSSLAGLAVALAMLFLFPPALRPLGLAALGLGATLVLLALAFSYRYDVFVPAWFGVRRLFEYGAIPVVLLGLALVEGGLYLLGRKWPGREFFVAATIVLLVSALVLPSSTAGPENARNAAKVVPLMNWIRRETDCDARILANHRTVGIFRVLTGRAAVLEGMGPFLRPGMLQDVVDLMLSARAFYTDPAGNQEFLVDRGVDYVVVLRKGRIGYGGAIGKFDPAGLEDVPFLRLAYSTPGFSIYRVQGLPPGPDLVETPGQPGYRCSREPLVLSASR